MFPRSATRTAGARWSLAAAVAAAAILAAASGARQAFAWSTPQPLFSGAAREVFAVAGDPSGNAFVVAEGSSLDRPLVLMERIGTGTDPFIWSGAAPFPGHPPNFTRGTRGLDSFFTSADGDGVGLIAWREVLEGRAQSVRAVMRDAAPGFSEPFTAVGPENGADGELSVTVNGSGDALIAFRRTVGRNPGRTGYVWRRSGGDFERPRAISPSRTSSHAVSLAGPGGGGVIAWTRGSKVESVRISGAGDTTKRQTLGRAKRSGAPRITAALNKDGAGVIAWQDDDGAVRLVRRSLPGRFSVSLPVRVGSKDAIVEGLTSAIDDRGRAYVAWRERRPSERRVYLAAAPSGERFKVTRLALADDLSIPSLAARPGGGVVAAWRAALGWRARLASAKGALAATATVSRDLVNPSDRTVPRAVTIAGPDGRVDLFWPQSEDGIAGVDGDLLYQSFDTP